MQVKVAASLKKTCGKVLCALNLLQELLLLLSHTLMCLNALQLHAGYIGHAQTH